MYKLAALLYVFLLTMPSLRAQDDSTRFSKLGENFIECLSREKYAEAMANFDAAMQEALPADKVAQIWQSLQFQGGEFLGAEYLRTDKYQEYHLVFVACKFQRADYEAKVVFNQAGQIAGLFFRSRGQKQEAFPKPDYAKTESFREIEVQVGDGEWALPGILSLPLGEGPFPAVVLVHGSGPNDRDETVGPNKPFRDLAWGLASRDIAVLRYDKRTLTHAQKIQARADKITVREVVIEDALLAVSLLRTRPEIDGSKIFVLGHSLGAMMAPRIGELAPDLAGLILMAAPARPLEDLIVEQYSYIFSLDQVLSEEEQRELTKIKEQAARVKEFQSESIPPVSELPLAIPGTVWLELRAYDQVKTAQGLRHPLLVLQGERDYQVTTADFLLWKQALSRKNVRFKLYPGLNHLMMKGEGPSAPQEYTVQGHISPAVLDDVERWVKLGSHIAHFAFQMEELEQKFAGHILKLQQIDPMAKTSSDTEWFISERDYHSEYSLEAATIGVQNYRLAQELIHKVAEKGWVLVTAESVTGGYLAATLSRCPNSGEWFAGGAVCYKIEAKRQLLGVPDTRDDELYDAQTAIDMALGAARLYQISQASKVETDETYYPKPIVAIATTGHAVTYAGQWEGGVHVGLVIPGKKAMSAYFPHTFTTLLGTREEARTKDEGMLSAVNKALTYALSQIE